MQSGSFVMGACPYSKMCGNDPEEVGHVHVSCTFSLENLRFKTILLKL